MKNEIEKTMGIRSKCFHYHNQKALSGDAPYGETASSRKQSSILMPIAERKRGFQFRFNRKAQVQIFETIAVLFVFFILIAIGFIFYGRIMKSNIESEKDAVSQLRSVAIAQRIMFLPELQCSEDNIIKENCIDILKLAAARQVMIDNEAHYYDIFEFGTINVSEIYPGSATFGIYSRKTNYKSKFVTNIPISLYNATSNEYYFGILTIETLAK